jgi:retinol dehydrogenase-12
MSGKVIIITGSSSGIGKASAIKLLEDGADVVFATRNKNKTLEILDALEPGLRSKAHWIKLDLCSLSDVESFVKEFKSKFSKLDILMNNAGVPVNAYSLTEDNIDTHLQSNYISHMYLTNLLLDYFSSDEGRIIHVSSLAHSSSDYTLEKIKQHMADPSQLEAYYKNGFTQYVHYGNTKLASHFFTHYLVEILEKKYSHIKSFTLHPGVVNTEMVFKFEDRFRKTLLFIFYPLIYFCFKTVDAGCQTQLDLCYRNINELENGGYFSDFRLAPEYKLVTDKEVRDLFMEYSFNLVRMTGREINFKKFE